MRARRGAALLLATALGLGVASAVPGAASAAAPPTDGLVLHYALTGDRGTVAEDLSGNDRDGRILGGAVTGAGGLVLDGVDDHVDMPDDLLRGLASVTVAFDVRIDRSVGSAYFVYGIGNTSSAGVGDGYLFAEGNPLRTAVASGNWSTEQNTQVSRNLQRDVWKHVTYTQTGTTGVLYEDGVEVARNTAVTTTPGSIGGGTTRANYIGRSVYSADPYLKGAVRDFRLYDRALTAAQVADVAAATAQPAVEADAAALTLGDTSAVTADLTLPASTGGGSSVTWTSSDPGVVSAAGAVTRPAAGAQPATATLTATVSQRQASVQRTFTVTVLPVAGDQDRATAAAAALVVHDVDDVRSNLYLPTEGPDGSTVTWATSDAAVLTATGEVTRPALGAAAAAVTLTATVAVGAATATRTFEADVLPLPAPAPYEGYLFSHFLGEGLQQGEQVYFSLSQGDDPLRYTNLNDGEPVMVSTSGEMGLRDPYIVRSPEGDRFYQIATDLRMWNQSSGSWDEVQRRGSRDIVVWESTDLVTWSESWTATVAPETAGNAWAPEIFYDDERGEYVVFWASKIYAEDDPDHTGSAYNTMLYATTRDFRTFSESETLIDYGYSVIDTTMIEHEGDVYRFSKNESNRSATVPGGKYVFQEVGSGPTADDFDIVKEAIGAGSINQGEGPTVFKSNTEERWYLFVDEYGGRGYVPFTTTDLASGEWTMLSADQYSFPSRFRHGTVLPVTRAEWRALQRAYGTPVEPEVTATAETRCVAGRVVQTVRVAHDADEALAAEVLSAYGTRTVSVAADRTVSVALSTRLASVPAGEVRVTADGGSATAAYAARSCG
ncbi:immunoglobulin-like domain-containing protein [Aquipuribacter hungaricus]|uniref:Immunoglobulin-like domain-containing protein n=1 Tax=Aquipuribacter hungaricus TaxID=545624 RepID=A0ABV7WI08_9MICO